ncbi:ATP-binding protein [Prevotella sp.]|uniref:ATP-binding protein n=1 Tax=Prevotella sp. TaxID=59823 RepID=UPI0027E3587B|nr:AAA family ATPase [Prevotella sp.]
MTTRRYPIGIQTFKDIIEQNYIYVDKTEYIYRLSHTDGKYFFLSRPRRFGKSLLVSTMKSYFEGKHQLFKGLAIERLETEWTEYPVLHFSMAGGKHMNKEQLERYLIRVLEENECKYSIKSNSIDPNIRLMNLIQKVSHNTGKQVVVLIDEYDAPLLDVVHENEQLPVLRNVIRNFYSPLKDCDSYLRFVFLTGITKFSQLSIFSELNNVKNISMLPEYDGICGITNDELLTQMSYDIDELANSLQLTRNQTIAKLRAHYDGYHFTWPSADIYNPFSLLNCFADKMFDMYWFSSGTPTYLIEMMRKFDVMPSEIGEGLDAIRHEFDAPTENMASLTPLLYQSGYMTIKDYDSEYGIYHLGIPNKEIRVGLFQSLLPLYLGQKGGRGGTAVAQMASLINRDDMDGALSLMSDFLETVPYCDNTKYEGHYQQMLYVIFSLLTNYRMQVEVRTHRGRIDVVLETSSRIYLIETKFDTPAEKAIQQILDNGYADAYKNQNKPVTMVGINFSVKETANIVEWLIK